MSNKQVKVSSKAQDGQSIDSVYDFLYNDQRRVGSFLSQFDTSGHLKEVSQTDTVGGHTTSSATAEGGLSAPFVAKASSNEAATEDEQHGSTRVYDPLWSNALTLLDFLDERGMLKRDMHAAGIGEFVILTGTLKILDLRPLKSGWEMPSIAKAFGVGNKPNMTKEEIANNKLGIDVIKLFPHTIQAYIYCPKNEAQEFSASWMTLNEAGMVVSPGDIIMKYGYSLDGTWTMVAIKDAGPDGGPKMDAALLELVKKSWDEAAEKRFSTTMALFAELLAPLARKVMGRPGPYYGVTPLMIFRKVGG